MSFLSVRWMCGVFFEPLDFNILCEMTFGKQAELKASKLFD